MEQIEVVYFVTKFEARYTIFLPYYHHNKRKREKMCAARVTSNAYNAKVIVAPPSVTKNHAMFVCKLADFT